jgi:folate-binding protein YgfZ
MSGISGAVTPLGVFLTEKDGGAVLCEHLGSQTVRQWVDAEQEFFSILGSAAVFDLGYRSLLGVSGGDQERWLNGMITNTIKGLEPGHSNYSFVLNAQGRILGDVTAYRCTDHILLATDASQVEALRAHFDHFIIMDDVELETVAGRTVLGVAGPTAAAVLAAAGLRVPEGELGFVKCDFAGERAVVSYEYSPVTPRFAVWLPEGVAPELWAKLREAGAAQAGVAALEMLRVVEGVPQFGVDFGEKYLPQEVDAARPLHFAKGCYLGQEIVERIRSRATVHRQMRVLELAGARPELPAAITVDGQAVGEVTSVAEFALQGGRKTLALGMVRNEPVAKGVSLEYAGGKVMVPEAEAMKEVREGLRSFAREQAAQ